MRVKTGLWVIEYAAIVPWLNYLTLLGIEFSSSFRMVVEVKVNIFVYIAFSFC